LSERDVEVFARAMDAFNERDLERFLDTWADNDEIEFVALRSAIEGPYRGRDGIRQWWSDTSANWAEFRVEPERLHDAGDGRVVGAGIIHAQGNAGGVPLDIPTSWLAELRDGRITRVAFFFDQNEAFAAVGLPTTSDSDPEQAR
jgi:ketosteroid isomerase-like protein